MTAVVGIDFSLASTGLARIEAGPDAKVWVGTCRTIPAGPSLLSRSLRLRTIADYCFRCARGVALVMIEGPSLGSKTPYIWDRAGGWWLLTARLTAAGIPVVEVPPASVKTYATGRGNASKDQVLAAVVRRYGTVEVDGNDQADSLILACMGARWLGCPIEAAALPVTHQRAMAKIAWPDREDR